MVGAIYYYVIVINWVPSPRERFVYVAIIPGQPVDKCYMSCSALSTKLPEAALMLNINETVYHTGTE